LIFAVVHYPNLDTQRINQFRRGYDPQVDLIEPHITHLQGLQRSSDDYLFLMIQEGKADIIGLHNEIYTGVLANFRKGELPHLPHVTLGVFGKDANEYSEALAAAKRLDLDYRSVLDKIHLLRIDDDRTRILWSKEFSLV